MFIPVLPSCPCSGEPSIEPPPECVIFAICCMVLDTARGIVAEGPEGLKPVRVPKGLDPPTCWPETGINKRCITVVWPGVSTGVLAPPETCIKAASPF